MKKILIFLVLATLLIAPVMANGPQKGDISIDIKAGIGLDTNLNFDLDSCNVGLDGIIDILGLINAPALTGPSYTSIGLEVVEGVNLDADMEIPFILSADLYYNWLKNLAIGIGISHNFGSKTQFDKLEIAGDVNLDFTGKIGFTNIYFAVKPEFAIDKSIFNSLYALGQFGLGIPHVGELFDSAKCGIYYGFGAGVEFKYGIILEALYTVNYTNVNSNLLGISDIIDFKADARYSGVQINVGYKFTF